MKCDDGVPINFRRLWGQCELVARGANGPEVTWHSSAHSIAQHGTHGDGCR